MNIWLDDMRDPRYLAHDPFIGEEKLGWVWVRNKRELEELLASTEGRIEIMSFDHDLGEDEPTGHQIIKWLADEHLDRYPVETRIHSGNVVGANNIWAYDKSVRYHLLHEPLPEINP